MNGRLAIAGLRSVSVASEPEAFMLNLIPSHMGLQWQEVAFPALRRVQGVLSVQRVVCGCNKEFKVISTLERAAVCFVFSHAVWCWHFTENENS